MSDGTHAGLQSVAAVSAQLKRRQRQEREEFERHRKSAQEEETVYRDATGRRIDISMQRAEARKAAHEAEEKKQSTAMPRAAGSISRCKEQKLGRQRVKQRRRNGKGWKHSKATCNRQRRGNARRSSRMPN